MQGVKKKVYCVSVCVVHIDMKKMSQGTYAQTQIHGEIWEMYVYLYSRCSMWLPSMSTQHSALRRTVSKIPFFSWISWQASSTRCSNISQVIDKLWTQYIFICHHSHKSRTLRSGDPAGQETPRPIHFPPKSDSGALWQYGKKKMWCPWWMNLTSCV